MKGLAVVLVFSLIGAGCSGDGGGGGGGIQPPASNPPPPSGVSPGGIWEGTLGSGQDVLGLVTESGEFHFLADDFTQYFGTASINGNSVNAQFTGYAGHGLSFQDGTTSGTGSLTGTVIARSTLTASSTFRTAAGNSNTNTLTLTYNALYERDSSLATVSGNYRDVRTGSIVNINTNGVAFAQNPANGCVLNGAVSIINANYNAYRVQYSYSGCRGVDAVLNGASFRGLATLDNTVAPEALYVGAQALSGSTGVSLIEILERT